MRILGLLCLLCSTSFADTPAWDFHAWRAEAEERDSEAVAAFDGKELGLRLKVEDRLGIGDLVAMDCSGPLEAVDRKLIAVLHCRDERGEARIRVFSMQASLGQILSATLWAYDAEANGYKPVAELDGAPLALPLPASGELALRYVGPRDASGPNRFFKLVAADEGQPRCSADFRIR